MPILKRVKSARTTLVESEDPVLPFLKWPGGKRWLSAFVAGLVGQAMDGTYYEPFLGGGSVYFALGPRKAVISDINADLISTYEVVRDRAADVTRRLRRLPVDRATFDRLRASEPEDAMKRAVRFLYLNRTAFSGIYRLNRFGKFNVPFGGGERTPDILWRRSLLVRAADALKGTQICHADFEPIVNRAKKGDVVYCDPTYTVAHEDNGFIRYNERNFSWSDQVRLAEAAKRARDRGAAVFISNAYHQCIRQLYSGAEFHVLERNSSVSTDRCKRRSVRELLIALKPNRLSP